MPRPPRKAFKTRRRAFQLGMEKEGLESIAEVKSSGMRQRVRENAKGYLKENDFKTRVMVYAAFVVVIIATVFLGLVLT